MKKPIHHPIDIDPGTVVRRRDGQPFFPDAGWRSALAIAGFMSVGPGGPPRPGDYFIHVSAFDGTRLQEIGLHVSCLEPVLIPDTILHPDSFPEDRLDIREAEERVAAKLRLFRDGYARWQIRRPTS